VNPAKPEVPDAPVWAREDAFPEAPPGWGWTDAKGNSHTGESLEWLAAAIRDDRDGSVTFVWAPGHPRLMPPEELGGMGDALRTARARWSRDDLEEANYKLRWFGAALVGFSGWAFYGGFVLAGQLAQQSGTSIDLSQRLTMATRALLSSTHSGLALLMFIIFAFIPWHQARKRRAELGLWTEDGIAEAATTIRFETWLERQQAPLTKVFLGILTLVALAQILYPVRTAGWGAVMALIHNWDGTAEAGLMKDRYLLGEWWRLFTAPLLHGNLLHFLMNASALLYLGKRVEVFARWPHVSLVFLFASCVGGEASARLLAAPSVGASGGLMGWLGFLLVFETLHKRLVPRRARRRLAAGVAMTAVIGLFGYKYIDNAAHAGGLIAGMLYAAIVDVIAGGAAMAALVAAALFAIGRMS